MPTNEHHPMTRSEFVAFCITGTANLDSARLTMHWSRTTYGDEPAALNEPDIVVTLPFTKADPADLVREALYQFAEKL